MPKYRFDNVALKRRRLESGKKPELIALDLDITKEAYIAYETGRSVPPTARVLALADEFGCEPGDLYAEVEDDLPGRARRSAFAEARAQGLPEQIEDPVALEEGAELLRQPAT